MFILGITGGIASGKSTVTRMFHELGAKVVDADAIARTLLLPGKPVAEAVIRAFPDCVDAADGAVIDRRALGSRIFQDAGARRLLESLTHPPIIADLSDRIRTYRDDPAFGLVVAEIPLLFEANLEALVDRILVVSCSETVQAERLMARLSVDAAEARRQIGSQLPLADKAARADYVVTTDGSLADTERQVIDLARHLGF